MDDKQLPVQQVEFLGKATDAFRIFPYGMSANVPVDFLCMLFPNGWFLPMSPLKRPVGLESGEVVFYHPITGAKTVYKNDGSIETDSENVLFTGNAVIAGDATIKGNLTVEGNLSVLGASSLKDVTSNGVNIDSTHTHLITSGSSAPGPTGPPS